MFFNQYPYLNINDLNLDFILNAIKEMHNEVTNFVSINAIKYANPIQWDITKQYEKNTVVIDPQTGTAYLSVAPVPAGVALTRDEFWTVVFDLGSFVTRAAKNFTTRYEQDTTLTATFNTSAGEWLVWGDTLYVANVNITAGDSYVVDGNIRHITIEEVKDAIMQLIANNYNAIIAMIGDLNNLTTTAKNNIVAAINEIVAGLSAEVQARQNADTALQNNINAEANARILADNSLTNITNSLRNSYDFLSQYVRDVVNDLAFHGIVLHRPNIIHVNVNGDNGKVTLPTAISMAESNDTNTLILLEKGTYNMEILFPPATYTDGMKVPENAYLIGEGRAEDVILVALLNTANLAYSPVNLTTQCGIYNMTIHARNARYCVHDDFSIEGDFTRIAKNVVFYGDTLSLRWAYGAGTKAGNKTIIENCRFKNTNGCFSIHNMTGSETPCEITVKNCNFTQYTYGDNPYDIILTAMGESDNVTTHGDVICNIENCDANAIMCNAQAGYHNYFEVNCNNPETLILGDYDVTRIHKKGYTNVKSINVNNKGKLVAFTNFNTQCRLFETAYSKAFANGVTISDVSTDGMATIIVASKCNVSPSEIGVPIQAGQYLNYDRTTDALVVQSTEGEVCVAYGLASNTWKLLV